MKVESLECTAQALFRRDQPALYEPLFAEAAEKLAKQFEFSEVAPGHTPDGTRVWLAHEGRVRRGTGPDVKIRSAHGHSLTLVVQAIGDSEAALAALRELWAFVGQAGSPRLEEVAVVCHRTTAVVSLAETFDENFAPSSRLEAEYLRRLRATSSGIELGAVVPRFRIDVAGRAGGQTLQMGLIIEPRIAATIDRSVYYTQSSLPSTEHLALVRQLLTKSSAAAPPVTASTLG